jgi:alkylation response protein AidB-like acyl-CoA dehydrogenase
MDYELSDAHKLIRDTARRIAREKVAPRAAELDESGEYPEDIFRVFAEAGLLGLTIPEQYGGSGAGFLALALAVEETAKHDNGCSLILLLSALSTQPINLGGSDEQKREWLSKSAVGAIKGAFCLTEPNTGSDAANLESRARRDGDDYVIDGSKRFISHGSIADLVVVFAVTDPEAPRHRRLSAFVVEVPTEGFAVTRLEHKMGIRGSPTAELAFTRMHVPATNRLGEEGDGFEIAMRTLDRSRPGIAAQAVGIAQGALEVAAAYARDRTQFGQRIGDFQQVGAMLADMDAQTEAARQLLYRACVEIDARAPDASRWSAMCKLVAGDTAMRVTTDAVQTLGGYGYIDEFPVERMMRDAKITQLYEGTQQIQRLVIARALLGKGG